MTKDLTIKLRSGEILEVSSFWVTVKKGTNFSKLDSPGKISKYLEDNSNPSLNIIYKKGFKGRKYGVKMIPKNAIESIKYLREKDSGRFMSYMDVFESLYPDFNKK